MATLYNEKMATIYDAMYQTFVDYDDEYQFYNTLIQEIKIVFLFMEICAISIWTNQ